MHQLNQLVAFELFPYFLPPMMFNQRNRKYAQDFRARYYYYFISYNGKGWAKALMSQSSFLVGGAWLV